MVPLHPHADLDRGANTSWQVEAGLLGVTPASAFGAEPPAVRLARAGVVSAGRVTWAFLFLLAVHS